MKTLILCAVVLGLPLVGMAQQQTTTKARKLFPYEYHIDDLPNGLRLVTVPTDFPNLVSLQIVVQVGSRNEVEEGKTGFAHFFEHMMFRGSRNYTSEQRDAVLKRAGAEANAYTSDDRTVYHETFSKEDLDEVMKLEADRFTGLKYDLPGYQTEAKAVKGEYDKNSANPFSKLYEVLRETAFRKHTYSHTTMGYLKDIEDMPNQYEYSLKFYERFYRPEYTTVLLVGDVTRARALELTKKYFSEWKRGNHVVKIEAEPAQTEARERHIDWPSATLPLVAVAFRGPAYSDEKKDKAALDLLAQIAFGENSELYQRLVLKEQKADVLFPDFSNQVDPELFVVGSRVQKAEDVPHVRQQIIDTFKRFTTELIPQAQLDATRSRLRYSVALSMNSSDSIADLLAPSISLRRTPETINRYADLLDTVTPEDVRRAAQTYFREDSRTIVTLAPKLSTPAQTGRKEGGR
jgi:zinc protease